MSITIEIPVDLNVSLGIPVATPSKAELALVQRLESGRAALPVLPAVAASALQLANDPNADIQRFSALVETDPPIAARFLGVANSAVYSRGRKVTSVLDAVMRIGLYSCRDLLFQAVYGATLRGLRHYQKPVEESFRRSVISAVVCRLVASELKSPFREAHLCGLLHDIGESRIYRILSDLDLQLGQPEVQDLVSRYHARAGAELALKWQLPKEIVEVCGKHHEPGASGEALRLVRIADWAVPHICDLLVGQEPGDLSASLAATDGLELPLDRAQAIVEGGLLLARKV
jgi:putative nucleotidyltransferase with HDIG domain